MPDHSLLVIRLGSLGDIVHTFPAVAALRESFPTSKMIWLTHPRWAELVASSALASEIWPVDSRDVSSVRQVIAKIRASRWDSAIDYQGLWKSAFLPFFGRVSERIGFSSATIREMGVPILYSDRVVCQTTHIADQNGELSLCAGSSQPVADFTLRICEKDQARVCAYLQKAGVDSYVVLTPGGGWRAKCWPPDRFAQLCKKIHTEYRLTSVINYGPGEESLAEEVRRTGAEANPIVYDGELGPLMALLRGARCIIGGDTGPVHLAIALGTPAVALFGPTDPKRNGPYSLRPDAAITLRSPNAKTSHVRSNVTDSSLLQLSVDEVFAAVKQRLGAPA
jgi:heptosyltransferase I